jgi:hypothetical protein
MLERGRAGKSGVRQKTRTSELVGKENSVSERVRAGELVGKRNVSEGARAEKENSVSEGAASGQVSRREQC